MMPTSLTPTCLCNLVLRANPALAALRTHLGPAQLGTVAGNPPEPPPLA